MIVSSHFQILSTLKPFVSHEQNRVTRLWDEGTQKLEELPRGENRAEQLERALHSESGFNSGYDLGQVSESHCALVFPSVKWA